MKETTRAHREDFKLEVVGGFNIKISGLYPERELILLFSSMCSLGPEQACLRDMGGSEKGEKSTHIGRKVRHKSRHWDKFRIQNI